MTTRIGLRLLTLTLLSLLTACNLTLPQVTPTVAPTRVPSATPELTRTATATVTITASPTEPATAIAQLVPSDTPTATPSPTSTGTPTDTSTPSPTPLRTSTGTATPTVTPSDTATPTPSATDTATPTATPTGTLPPSNTPSRTPTPTPTHTATTTPTEPPTITPSPPPTLTPSPTPAPSDTPTLTATATGTATATPTLTATATPTDTLTPSDTPSITPTASDTPPPTLTPSDTPSITPIPSPTPLPPPDPTATPTPPPTLTASPTLEPRPTFTPTRLPTVTPQPSPTEIALAVTPLIGAIPSPTPGTPTPAPTQNVTPTFITITAPAPTDIVFEFTPLPATTTPQLQETPLLRPTSTLGVVALPTQGDAGLPSNLPTALPGLPSTRLYTLDTTGGGTVNIGQFDLGLPNFTTEIFAQNPANPNQYAVVNGAGQIFFVNDYLNVTSGGIQQIGMDIFTEFTYQVRLADENDANVTRIAWANDGTLAFIIDADRVNKDGVWFWHPPSGGQGQFLRECPPLEGCNTTLEKRGMSAWEAVDLAWSPDSQALLIQINIPDENRTGFVVAERFAFNPEIVPPVARYTYAHWSTDSQRIVVSGRDQFGQIVMGTVRRDGLPLDIIDMRARGWAWTRDAVEYNGQLYGFASRDGEGGPLQLIDASGTALTEPLGSRPRRIDWSPDNSAALIVFDDGGGQRYYVVTLPTGSVREITAQVADAITVEWVRGGSPGLQAPPPGVLPSPIPVQPTPAPPAAPTIAPPVAPNDPAQPPTDSNNFVIGGRAIVIPASGVNLRTDATVDSAILVPSVPPTTIVTLLNGPLFTDNGEWWQVELPDGTIGWMAATFNGAQLLGN